MPAPRPIPAPVARAPHLRVLVVDDSPFMQRRMTELLERDGDLEIVGTARDGVDAIRRAAELRPDVITMDLHMPRMDGLCAIEHIMHTQPRPIVVVSSFVRGVPPRPSRPWRTGRSIWCRSHRKGASRWIWWRWPTIYGARCGSRPECVWCAPPACRWLRRRFRPPPRGCWRLVPGSPPGSRWS
ncbi:MAG: response regulator [Opitutaceae bacterium]|nr:response regulator [Opitutaceae bacterium]